MAKQTKLEALVETFKAKGLVVESYSARSKVADASISFANGVCLQLSAACKMSIVQTHADGKMSFGFENSTDVNVIASKVRAAIQSK
jgi:hypothetical protein